MNCFEFRCKNKGKINTKAELASPKVFDFVT